MTDKYSQAMSTLIDIDQMSPEERLKTMELLWDRLVRDAGVVESPSWHGEVLEERLEKVRQGTARFLSLDEVRRRLDRAS